MWLSVHCECWEFGHVWQLGPWEGWCERCEDVVKGERAKRMYEAKYGPYVPQPLGPGWPPMKIDLNCPPDSVYMLDMSLFQRGPEGEILAPDGTVIVPPYFGQLPSAK